ncbi:radical SAM protein [Sphingomonas sp. CGMCC 1.13654]|uniref:Radical SAM protein n=1 Tax=Sphingomonas chungangi TaxID=2683589 RepID=A0A838L9Q3_9SPHN|nr:radical SAM protein [Sphingomonas chungangi]MBA2934238.1 radical SAM protein [Sphingomonas chungangi]MVW57279.1 radical SAM protein [Sphingomonas chungangi]
MTIDSLARSLARAVPATKPALRAGYAASERMKSSLASQWPSLIGARTEKITIAITAHCNLRCQGCKYGRDFMPGAQLPLETVRALLEDAAAAKVPAVRLYGGEPLLHPDVVEMVRLSRELGVGCYMTTNALILDRKIAALHAAGLRKVTIGYYGQEGAFDDYVQRPGRFDRLVESLTNTRALFGPDQLDIQFNFLLSRRSATIAAVDEMIAFADRFRASVHIDVVHYSLPYFQEGPERELQFRPEDRPAVDRVIDHLLRIKAERPDLLTESAPAIASFADWALKQEAMRIPCDARKLLWVGADGSVMLCYVTFPLGNLHEKRLSEILYKKPHHEAARAAFRLDCPNCHCEAASRVEKHAPSLRLYAKDAAGRLAR